MTAMSRIENEMYPEKNCWPDMIDFMSALKQTGRRSSSVEARYQHFRISFEWLQIAFDCRRRGKNRAMLLTDLKKMAEGFCECELNEDAFVVAAYLVTNDRNLKKACRKFRTLQTRVPVFNAEKIGTEWRGHIECVERQAQTAAANN
jgi:hypothetical protein